MKKFLAFFVIFMVVPIFALRSQNEDIASIIKNQLSAKGQRKMERSEKLMQKYKNLSSQIGSSGKATRKQITVSRKFGKANKIAYKAYSEDLQKFTDIDRNDSAKVIKKRIARAKKQMKLAHKNREAALQLNVTENEYSVLKHADELETKAFANLYSAYSLILGTNKGKQELVKKETNETQIDNNENKISANKIDLDNKLKTNKLDTLNAKNQVITENKTVNTNNIVEEKNTELSGDDNPNAKVFFKIQIAASNSQLSVDQLVKNYKTNEVFNVEKEGDWYKYSIRKKFYSYEEALTYKENVKIKGAFIIAFKNGKKVSIDEAMRKDEVVNNVSNEKIENKPTENVVSEGSSKINYRLQIGLSTKALAPNEISEFNSGGKEVYVIDRGSWFIYVVGDFDTEIAALNFKRLKKMSDSEVVKFKNGKLIEE